MKMQTLFATVFNEEMKARGYKRKGRFYYRLNGDILQGVVIKTINPYTIHFYAAPYWTRNAQMEMNSITDGSWAEDGFEVSPGLGAYYREENEELNLAYMNACLNIAKLCFLPLLDEINDLDSYFEHLVPNWFFLDARNRNRRWVSLEVEELNKSIDVFWDMWPNLDRHLPFLYYGCMHNDLDKGYQLIRKLESRLQPTNDVAEYAKSLYRKFLKTNDLESAKQYFAERKEIMLKRLSEELKLDISHL